MTIKITGRASSNDDNANVSVARESVQRLGERVTHLLVEIDAPCAAQRNDRNSVGYSCRQNIGVHRALLDSPCRSATLLHYPCRSRHDGVRGRADHLDYEFGLREHRDVAAIG